MSNDYLSAETEPWEPVLLDLCVGLGHGSRRGPKSGTLCRWEVEVMKKLEIRHVQVPPSLILSPYIRRENRNDLCLGWIKLSVACPCLRVGSS